MSLIDKTALLKSIELQGSADDATAKIKPIINGSLSNVIDKSSGTERIKPSAVGKFAMILSQPSVLLAVSSLEIRCLACGSVIKYPAWHYTIRYAVKVFHYFVCFEPGTDKPNLNWCKR
jgi:hypothetical protein